MKPPNTLLAAALSLLAAVINQDAIDVAAAVESSATTSAGGKTMDFTQVVVRRYSVRSFQNTPVDERKLHPILDAINKAPSAGNLQAYEVVVVQDADRKKQLAKAALEQWFIEQAPVVLVFLANPDRNRAKYGSRGTELYSLQDATIACAYAQLATTATGLGSCWVGRRVKKLVSAEFPRIASPQDYPEL